MPEVNVGVDGSVRRIDEEGGAMPGRAVGCDSPPHTRSPQETRVHARLMTSPTKTSYGHPVIEQKGVARARITLQDTGRSRDEVAIQKPKFDYPTSVKSVVKTSKNLV